MIKNLLIKIATIFGGILAIFTFGNLLGRQSQKTKQLEENYEDAIKSKQRQEIRRFDDISDVRGRMQKYIRK